ncbi:SAM-dependent methyltransferase [Candidatus Micrarchaeota archaeon]|nr:SAM-dependent methyltransferase [Candidatus Micrarchaeota archaeon]
MQPFDEIQRGRNKAYYSSEKTTIYSDFKTFGGSEKVAYANAIEFCSRVGELEDGVNIYEFGIGSGMFAYYFLEKVYELKPEIKLNYFLCDSSGKIIENAKKKLKKFSVEAIVCNAEEELDFLEDPFYIRSNELCDDLSAKFFVKVNEDGIKEVYFDRKLNKEYTNCEEEIIKAFMKTLPENYEIPINFGAGAYLNNCKKKLRKGGYIDSFDYGFASLEEVKSLPLEIWNNSIVREFNGQLTTDVNFIWLQKELGGMVEGQREYTERILKRKLYYVELEQLEYFDEADIKSRKKELKENDYEEDFILGGIDELDEYKHFRVEKR